MDVPERIRDQLRESLMHPFIVKEENRFGEM